MSLCSCQYSQIYHIYLCGKKSCALGTMGLIWRENWDGNLLSTNAQCGSLPWWPLLWVFLLFTSCYENQNQTNCVSATEEKKNQIFDSFITTEVNRQLLIFLGNQTKKKKGKKVNLSNVCHWRTSLSFVLLFLSLFLLQKRIQCREF